MPVSNEAGASYSSGVGLVFIFNIIVGTGALAMPKAFYSAGWLTSAILLVVLAVISFISVTYIIEAMAAANALMKLERARENRATEGREQRDQSTSETNPLLGSLNADRESPPNYHSSAPQEEKIFEITERIEMGQMAAMFFNRAGRYVFYISIIVYLYGDMTIYSTAVAKSIRDVSCSYTHVVNGTCSNVTLSDDDPCWPGVDLTRKSVMMIFVAAFTLLFGPLVFFNVQKTSVLQLLTTVTRWLAFTLMIVLAIMRLASGQGTGNPGVAHLRGVPVLFGTCVYSFMCHHSLPSLVTPIRHKASIRRLFALDFLLILIFYALLSFTGIFAFDNIYDLYTLNFQPNDCSTGEAPVTNIKVFQYFLALFPAFTLTTSYPVLGITLRNNIKTLAYSMFLNIPSAVDRLVFPLLVVLPPLGVALFVHDIGLLVGITGSYGGVIIQYMVPGALVLCTRRATRAVYGNIKQNHHRSPFAHTATVVVILVWSVICMAFSTVNFALKVDA